jgi:hypothetical protein
MLIYSAAARVASKSLTEASPAKAGCLRRISRIHMPSQRPVPSSEGRRIVICDYNALLQSVTGLLRMSRFCVFQAHDRRAAQELCIQIPGSRC